ncbi:integrin alpha-M-like isoform X2 [Gouania willdenowi]|uniref:integrin alpha-M-like isoform X2 n=1 Tax=Gouania willdenowi TaxID=441366 RepID=UPI0010568B09|nr:integrin alpha-M-like isoform X2 [Gouania willdenowi]
MIWTITAVLFLAELETLLCFNIDPVAWKSLRNPAAGFGYQVVQRQSDLLVSAPLAQFSPNGRGQIYRCDATNNNCKIIPQSVFAVNMSLGLTMTIDPKTQNTIACGPTIPKDCRSITMYKGMCLEIRPSNTFGSPIPRSLAECQTQADIAFLLDGSTSVSPNDFIRMKTFVKDVINSFIKQDTQFSITQFSDWNKIHYYFNTFNKKNWKKEIDKITQLGGGTNTAAAIRHVVRRVFSPDSGSRLNVKKVLVVIADGDSHDRKLLPKVASEAQMKKILRFAIGVGSAFTDEEAQDELNTIASHPSQDYVFTVDGFDALEKIRENLQEKIFSIEGSKTSGESLTMEMSQDGFRAAFTPKGILMSVVGENQWRGGYIQYKSNGQEVGSYKPYSVEPDSYLGYSIAVAQTPQGTLTVLGAPRYKHKGMVMAVSSSRSQMITPYPQQTGEYFGAEVCSMDLQDDGYTDLILISAPMHQDPDREGRVYICRIISMRVECLFDSEIALRGDASVKGRFGSSLAVLPDLNTDGLADLAVGAPLENDGQGSIYIFHGEGMQWISPLYSQRIPASEVESGLRFFGISISPLSLDQSGDKLPDLAVGSKGRVLLLRSRPIVMIEATVAFTPNQIPTQNPDCIHPLASSADICFIMIPHSAVDRAQARINFTFTLDATRKFPNNRAYMTEKQRGKRKSSDAVDVDLNRRPCPDDALNELRNELQFTFKGLSLGGGLKPSLAQEAQTTTFHPIGFEIYCGTDNRCVDNLKVDFNFTSSSEIRVGIDELLDVTVSIENLEENSYNSHVTLTYPVGLSYRKFISLEGRIQCDSIDSGDDRRRGNTVCSIDKPIFKSNTKALFIVSYGITTNSELGRSIFISANATSGNHQHSPASEVYKVKEIDVKYSIVVTIESSFSYSNFSFGMNNLQKPVKQLIKVTNDLRVLNLTVVIQVPVKLGEKDIWANVSSLQIPGCQIGTDEEPQVKDFVSQIEKNKVVDCSVALCRQFKCKQFMGGFESTTFKISANLSSGWIEQIGLESAKFLLTSTASLEFDRNQYIFFSAGSNTNPPVRKVEVEVEVYPAPDFTKAIIGGSLGGLTLLILLTAGLYRAGFFKSKYKEMIDESATSPEAEDTAPQE